MKKTSLIGAALVMANPAMTSAQELKVGIIDVQANRVPQGDKNTYIDYREYKGEGKDSARWMTSAELDHGQLVVGSFVAQARKIDKNVRIKIFSANIFEEKQATTANDYLHASSSKRSLSVNWEEAKKALAWFKENDVKVVLTSFTSGDTEQLRSFMDIARKNKMIVFASAGNEVGKNVYPAAYPDTISIAGDDKNLSYSKDPKMATWVKFTMDGKIPIAINNAESEVGSSFSSAKAAAFGAYYSMMNPQADQMQMEQALKDSAVKQQYEIRGIAVTALKIVPESVVRIRQIAIEDKEHFSLAAVVPSQESEPPSKANKANQVLAVSLSQQNGY